MKRRVGWILLCVGFLVLSANTLFAQERWVYRYNGPGNDRDEANSIVMGSDGNLYAAGPSEGSGTSYDFAVISLNPDVGVEEGLNRPSVLDFRLWQNEPNPLSLSSSIKYSLPTGCDVSLSLYDVTGRLVEVLVNKKQEPGIHQLRWNRKYNPSGVYFYRLKACPELGEGQSRRAGEFVETRKMVVVQ